MFEKQPTKESAITESIAIETENGETINIQTTPDALREVGAGNFDIGQTVQINGHEANILGVGSMFAEPNYRPNDPNNVLWLQVKGRDTAMYLRLNTGETYDSILESN